MTAVTFASFVNELEALTITGVNRTFSQGQPGTLNTADLPAQWVDLPRGDAQPATSSYDFIVQRAADINIALEPVGQNRRPTNFDAVIAMMDNIETALKVYGGSANPININWQSKLVYLTINTVDYWAVTTTVTRSNT